MLRQGKNGHAEALPVDVGELVLAARTVTVKDWERRRRKLLADGVDCANCGVSAVNRPRARLPCLADVGPLP